MTENQIDASTEPVDLDTEADLPDPDKSGDEEADKASSPNAEAAKYRRKLRAAETKLEVQTARTEMLIRREVERLAADRLADGTDVWRDDTQLADLVDGEGLPDTERVTARVADLLDAHGHWDKPGSTPPASTVTGDGKPPGGDPSASWQDVYRNG